MKNNNNTKLLFELALIKIINESQKKEVEKEQNNLQNTKKIEKNTQNEQNNVEKQTKTVENSEKYRTKNEQAKQNTTPAEFSKQTSTKKIRQLESTIIEENKKIHEKLEKLKHIRIDNTLSYFNKSELKQLIPKLEKLNDMLINPDYSHSASIILDGTLKAASNTNLIFVYKTNRLANLFNENLPIIEQTIEKILNKKYNLIATDIDDWEIIKKEFNQKLRQFTYQEEKEPLDSIFKDSKENENINNLFEEIIEYN